MMQDSNEWLEQENRAVLSLVQAMIGAISTNFRRVSLAIVDDTTHLQFVLHSDFEEDREAIADIVFAFESLHERRVDIAINVVITTQSLSVVPKLRRVVFAQRSR